VTHPRSKINLIIATAFGLTAAVANSETQAQTSRFYGLWKQAPQYDHNPKVWPKKETNPAKGSQAQVGGSSQADADDVP
jgi:hypothetical protein